ICYIGLCRLDPANAVKYLPVIATFATAYPREVAFEPVLRSALKIVGWRAMYIGLSDILRADTLERKAVELLTKTLLRSAPISHTWRGETLSLTSSEDP